MIEIISIEVKPNNTRIAKLIVKYYDLVLDCDLCMWKGEVLWVRMPEMWITQDKKKRFVEWVNKEISDGFQKEILKMIHAKTGLDLMKCKEIMEAYWKNRKVKKPAPPLVAQKPKMIEVPLKKR